METNIIHQGNAIDVQATFPDQSIDMCMTSPPYWGLRDYGLEDYIWDDKGGCIHYWDTEIVKKQSGGTAKATVGNNVDDKIHFENKSAFCKLCGAWRGQLGLEPTPGLYIKHLCDIFDETHRVLKDGGSLWVNIADTYSSSPVGRFTGGGKEFAGRNMSGIATSGSLDKTKSGIPAKSLIGIPERFVKYIYFFTKNKKYYFEQQFDKSTTYDEGIRDRDKGKLNKTPGRTRMAGLKHNKYKKRNKRTVWSITTKPFKGAHFAVFPEELCETPIKAACPRGGVMLDTFFGSGTLGAVAKRLGRNYIGIELNPEYIEIANERLKNVEQELDL